MFANQLYRIKADTTRSNKLLQARVHVFICMLGTYHDQLNWVRFRFKFVEVSDHVSN